MLNFIKKHIYFRFSALRGFSLAELSIVMVIVGFIAASAISVAISNDYTTKRDETETKLTRIEEALAGYLATNHRLPCPADGTVAITATTGSGGANFGVESNNGASPPVCNKNFNTGNVWGGVVPVTTLQLPNDFMFDGWGRRIDYIVDYRFTNNSTTNAACVDATDTTGTAICFRDTAAGSITVNDATGAARTTTAVYVLLSHGENGHGAFPKPGSATNARINGFPVGNPYRNATASADEFTNAKVDNTGTTTAYTATFVMRDYTRNDDTTAAATARTYFDDQLRYKTKAQVVKAAGASIYDYVCRTALYIINNPGSNDCTGATDNTQCETYATEVNARCLQ